MAKLAREGKADKKWLIGEEKLPDPPPEVAHILLWYRELRAANPRGWRFEPVPYSEIMAYRDLHVLSMDTFDVAMLRRLDGIWQEVQPEPEKPKGS